MAALVLPVLYRVFKALVGERDNAPLNGMGRQHRACFEVNNKAALPVQLPHRRCTWSWIVSHLVGDPVRDTPFSLNFLKHSQVIINL